MKILMLAASLSKDSCNKKLISVSAQIVKDHGVNVDIADFREFSAINYNSDMQKTHGFPNEVTAFVQRLQESDGLIISSPEYNHSIPGTLKNLIDWASRIRPMPWNAYPILLMSASPSSGGGNRGLLSTRVPLEACGAFVFSNMFSLASAHDAFDDQNQLNEEGILDRLNQNIITFIEHIFMIKKLNPS